MATAPNYNHPLGSQGSDLQFSTSVNTSINQNVPVPPVPASAAAPQQQQYGMTGSMDGQAAMMAPGGAAAAAAAPVRPALQMFSDSSHPMACLFHLLFKASALFLYIFGGWFSRDGSSEGSVSGSNFITVTVLCILLMSADFWVVKNVTGRLLVGLRWWCQVEPSGENRWVFESAETTNVNKFDNFVFWTVLYGTPALWSGLFILGVLKFNLGWLITVCMAIALSGANLYGYWKCSSDQKAKFQAMVEQGSQMGAMYLLKSGVLNMLGRGAMAQASGGAQGGQAASTFV